MTSSQLYVVRPLSRSPRVDLKDIFRVYLSSTALQIHKLHPGDVCMVLTTGDTKGPVIVWPAHEKIQDTIIQVSKPLQVLYEIKLGDKISLSQNNESVEDSARVNLREVPQANSAAPPPTLHEVHKPHWIHALELILQEAEFISPGVVLENVEHGRQRRAFEVVDVNSSSDRILYRVQPMTKISIDHVPPLDGEIADYSSQPLYISNEGIGGLEKQLDQLNKIVIKYSDDHKIFVRSPDYRPRRGGIMLYGASGTGKSTILQSLARAGWRKVLHVETSATDRRSADMVNSISRIFEEARRNQPSLVIIDEIEFLAGKRSLHSDETSAYIAPDLGKELDRLGSARVLVIAATESLQNIDEKLRIPRRFNYEIEIPVPSAKARADILKVLLRQTKEIDNRMLEVLAERTHAFVGADLDRLIQCAFDKAEARLSDHYSTEAVVRRDTGSKAGTEITTEVIATDFDEALIEVRPTAMREVFLETPNVKWSDIGGQDEVKKSLAQAIEWPLKYSADMAQLGVKPKKGLLLYGPPGCSKTLIAKAVATESGLNFLAVKGGELLSMYVGESERAVREVFRKARSASPSVLFFDEIDTIGGSRDGNSQHGGLNVVATLLNELDGIEPLRGVFVIAATNKPDILDPALIRPGRFGTMLFVGLPDDKARREIIQLTLRKMDVDNDISLEKLTAQTQGYSGAELVSICEKAAFAALGDRITLATKQRVDSKHFEAALAETTRQITTHDIERFQNWGKTGGAEGSFEISTRRTIFEYVNHLLHNLLQIR